MSFGPRELLPFPLDRSGNRIEIDLVVFENRAYSLNLFFPYIGNDPANLEAVSKLVGSSAQKPDGKQEEHGVPLRLFLTMVGVNDFHEIVHYKKERVPGPASRGNGRFTKTIDKVELKRGLCRLKLTNLLDAPQFKGMATAFGVV